MSKLIRRRMLSLGSAAMLSLFTLLPAMASGGGEDAYRCVVQGDRDACSALPASSDSDAATRLVPGSYARYLIHNGYSVEQAVAEARASGEQPTLRVVKRDVPRQLTSLEAYERLLGHKPATSTQRDTDVANRPMPVVR